MRVGLTKDVYDFCVWYVLKHGYFPTCNEIGERFNADKSVIFRHIKKLERDGYIETDVGDDARTNAKTRAYRIKELGVVRIVNTETEDRRRVRRN